MLYSIFMLLVEQLIKRCHCFYFPDYLFLPRFLSLYYLLVQLCYALFFLSVEQPDDVNLCDFFVFAVQALKHFVVIFVYGQNAP